MQVKKNKTIHLQHLLRQFHFYFILCVGTKHGLYRQYTGTKFFEFLFLFVKWIAHNMQNHSKVMIKHMKKIKVYQKKKNPHTFWYKFLKEKWIFQKIFQNNTIFSDFYFRIDSFFFRTQGFHIFWYLCYKKTDCVYWWRRSISGSMVFYFALRGQLLNGNTTFLLHVWKHHLKKKCGIQILMLVLVIVNWTFQC